MDKKSSLSTRIEKLRDEISEKIDGNLHNMTIDELVSKSNELNKLIVEYHKLINTNND
ncbi:aspartyl-phosphate phosphatase Spo0E family protein [Wukongibacter baidiensis]|uniref:aspartyl-phosphate phosphatase Spo0E family protein n=1 Tax=Wukongibacter baidiensis TaxID=1723361 RepID=UPI003D7F6389